MLPSKRWICKAFFLYALSLFPIIAVAQTGTLVGSVADNSTGEPLTGVTIRLEGTSLGAYSDVEGNFSIQVPVGSYTVKLFMLSYDTLVVQNVVIQAGQESGLQAILREANIEGIPVVTIVATPDQASQNSILVMQQMAPVIADGVSAQFIRTTPDRDLTQVMRRVSGVTVQDGGFLIVRGLSERYTVAMLNGLPMASTEPDRRAFSFDLFPSNMVDNLFVVKTASPDLPAEFGGAVVQVRTLGLPSRSFLNVNLSQGWHSLTTFKDFERTDNAGINLLGLDNGNRALPGGFPSTQQMAAASNAERVQFGKAYGRSYGTHTGTANPDARFQFSGGWVLPFGLEKRNRLSMMAAIIHNNQFRIVPTQRADYRLEDTLFQPDYLFRDIQYNRRVLNGGMGGLGLQLTENHQLSYQFTHTVNTLEQAVKRTGEQFYDLMYRTADILFFNSNALTIHQLSGEHKFKRSGLRADWALSLNTLNSEMPDYRRLVYTRDIDSVQSPLEAVVPSAAAQPGSSGTFFSTLDQTTVTGIFNIEKDFKLLGRTQKVKAGGFFSQAERAFSARNFGFRSFPEGIPLLGTVGFDPAWLQLPPGQIFQPQHIADTLGFFLDEITNPKDYYEGTQTTSAAYAMFDNSLGARFRLVWGLRFEQFGQQVRTFAESDFDRDSMYTAVDRTYENFLPSLNLTCRLREGMNLRLAGSQTVARPTLRELAPFSYYDFQLNLITEGNINLRQTTISNVDLRWEWFPGMNQLISATVFYKQFTDPIEQSYFFDLEPAIMRYVNAQNGAENQGAELEIRKNLDVVAYVARWIWRLVTRKTQIRKNLDLSANVAGLAWLSRLYVLCNLSYIQSRVDVSNIPGEIDDFRPLQGQSNYVLNAGLQYLDPEHGTTVSLLVNQFGRRIWQVGIASPTAPEQSYPHIWENPRTIFDIKIAQRFWKQRLEVNITASDLLAPDFLFYQDVNKNGKWDSHADNMILRQQMGRSVSVGMGLRW